MTDQPRWPAGTPVRPDGGGPGGGRFRPVGRRGVGGWVEIASGRLTRGWANDESSRLELARLALEAKSSPTGLPPGASAEDYSGETATTHRVDLPDGRSVIVKSFDEAFSDWGDYEDEDDDGELPLDRQPTENDLDMARAEWVTSRIGQMLGVLVPPVVYDPKWAGAVWMGHIDGELGWTWQRTSPGSILPDLSDLDVTTPPGQDAWRLGLLDLLIGNGDRNGSNWLWTPEGRLVAIDHANAEVFVGGGLQPPGNMSAMHVDSPFAALYYGEPERDDGGRWGTALDPNPLHTDDIDAVAYRLKTMHVDGMLEQREYDYMVRVLELLRPYAQGDRRLIP